MYLRLLQLIEKKYENIPLSIEELEELKFLLRSEASDTNETLAISKFLVKNA